MQCVSPTAEDLWISFNTEQTTWESFCLAFAYLGKALLIAQTQLLLTGLAETCILKYPNKWAVPEFQTPSSYLKMKSCHNHRAQTCDQNTAIWHRATENLIILLVNADRAQQL